MKAMLVSKRFHPGHTSHLYANSLLLEYLGFDVRFDINMRYFSFSEEFSPGKRVRMKDYVSLQSGDLYIVWFPSLSALFSMLIVRLVSAATVVYVYHEPYTSFKSYRSSGFSRSKTIKVTAISAVNRILCLLSHKIILPSLRAFNALPEARTDPNRYAKINLMFADEAEPGQIGRSRSYISYIGTVAEDHAFEEFVKLAHECILQHACAPLRFLIATRSVMPEKLAPVIKECLRSGRLVVHAGAPLTNSQINEFFAESYVVWNAYKRSMQSGVLPKAYMFGTPVIMSAAYASEYFENDFHGATISDRYCAAELIEALGNIEKVWSQLSANCRRYYLDNFDYRSLSSSFSSFVLD